MGAERGFERVGGQELEGEAAGVQEKNEWEKMADEVRKERAANGGLFERGVPVDGMIGVNEAQAQKDAWMQRAVQEQRKNIQERRAEARAHGIEQVTEQWEKLRETFRRFGQRVLSVVNGGSRRSRNGNAVPEAMQGVIAEDIVDEGFEGMKSGALDGSMNEAIGSSLGQDVMIENTASEIPEDAAVGDEINSGVSLDEGTKEAFVSTMSSYREREQRQREFEAVRVKEERYLNEKLTSAEELAAAAETGTRADLRKVEYDGVEIPIYDMKGYPVAMLSHDVGFSLRTGGTSGESIKKAKEVIEHPETWMQGNSAQNMLSTLSTSYFDSATMSEPVEVNGVAYDQMRENLKTDAVRYGWAQVRPNSLIKIVDTDGAVPARFDKDKRFDSQDIQSVRGIEQRREAKNRVVANEVAMLRYDEQGKPMPPDYLVTLDGKITEDTLRHAAFFKVPIVNIESRYYGNAEDGNGDDIEEASQ